MRRPRFLVAIAVAFLALLAPAPAELFQRNAGEFLEGLGWSRGYSTPMKINGQQATVEVWSSPSGFFKTMAELEDHCGDKNLPHTFTSGEAIGFGMAVDGSTLQRWLVTRVDDADRSTVVTQTTMSLDAFHRGDPKKAGVPGAPRKHQLAAIPAYDQSEAMSHYHDGNTDTQVEVSRTAQPAIFIQGWFDRKMQAAGWARPLEDAGPAGTRVYTRKNERAFVTLRDAKQGGSLITRVYKNSSKR